MRRSLASGERSATTRPPPSFPFPFTERYNLYSIRSSLSSNHRPLRPHHSSSSSQYPNSTFPPNHRRDRPPSPGNSLPGTRNKPNFVVQLVNPRVSDASYPPFPVRKQEIVRIASACEIPEESVNVPQFGNIAGSFGFRQWVEARSAVVALWRCRLQGKHCYVPVLIPNVIVPSDMDELRDKLCELFLAHVRWLIENGDCVKKVKAEIDEKCRKVMSFASKRGLLKFEAFEEKKALEAEKGLMLKRLDEFKYAMKSIVRFLKGKDGVDEEEGEGDVAVFDLKGDYVWQRIHSLIRRECRRLEDGLPIYAYRRDILKRIHCQQVYL